MSCKEDCCNPPLPSVSLDYAGVEKFYTYPSCGFTPCTNYVTDPCNAFVTSYGGGCLECEIILGTNTPDNPQDPIIVLGKDANLTPSINNPPKWQSLSFIGQFSVPEDAEDPNSPLVPAYTASYNRDTCNIEYTYPDLYTYTEFTNVNGSSDIDTDDGFLKYICISNVDIQRRVDYIYTGTEGGSSQSYEEIITYSGTVSWYKSIQYDNSEPTVDQGLVTITNEDDYFQYSLYGTTCAETRTSVVTYDPNPSGKVIFRYKDRWQPQASNESTPIPLLSQECPLPSPFYSKSNNGQIIAYGTPNLTSIYDIKKNLFYYADKVYFEYDNTKYYKIDSVVRLRFSRPITCYFKAWFTVSIQEWKQQPDHIMFGSNVSGETIGDPITTEHVYEWEESGTMDSPCIGTQYSALSCENNIYADLDFVPQADKNRTIKVCLKKWSILKDYEPTVENGNPIYVNLYDTCVFNVDNCKGNGLPVC